METKYIIENKIRNDNLLRALKGEAVDRTPVWIMRQAGRYLPEYREVRKNVKDFMQLCQTPKLACEVTMQPIKRFDLDASIMFSDILVIPHAMGMDLEFIPGKGPVFHNPIKNENDIDNLKLIDPNNDLSYVLETIDLIKSNLNNEIPLIGFSGSPWTLATYMIEGAGSKQFSIVKKMAFESPDLLLKLLDKLADAIINYFDSQIKAGVNALMLFDTWGGILDLDNYKNLSLNFMDKIIKNIRAKYGQQIPITIFTKGGGLYLPEQASINPDGVGLDWTVNLTSARAQLGEDITMQGNLDPCALFAPKDKLGGLINKVLEQAYKPNSQNKINNRYIFNLGHGILPPSDPDKLDFLIKQVHNFDQINKL